MSKGLRRNVRCVFQYRNEKPFSRSSFIIFVAALFMLSGCLANEEVKDLGIPPGTTNITQNTSSSSSPAIAANGQTVYLIWTDTANGIQDIFLVRSNDGGQTFSAPQNVSETGDASTNGQIAVSGTSVYVVWEEFLSTKGENDIFFRKAEDNASSLNWSAKQNLSLSDPICDDGGTNAQFGPVCPSQFPTIAADGDQVLVAWSEASQYVLADITQDEDTGKDFRFVNSNILLLGSADRGQSFTLISSTPQIISKQIPTISLNPTLASAGGTFFVAWSDFIPPNKDQGDAKIFFRSFSGSVFNPPLGSIERVLSNPVKGSGSPTLAASLGATYLVWEGTPPTATGCQPGSDIFLSQSTDGFATVPSGDPINISASACRANNGMVSVSGDQVYIVWEDNAPELSGILFRKSSDGGATFSEKKKLTNTGGSISAPAISATENAFYFAWEDAGLGNLEIFFSKE